MEIILTRFTSLVLVLCYWLSSVKMLQIDKDAYIRNNFTNTVIQDKEIVRYRLRDYFGSSFSIYDYLMFEHGSDDPKPIKDEKLAYITKPFTNYIHGWFPNKETTTPRKNSAKLLKIHYKNTLERTFLFYINEAYEAKIIDMTFYEEKKMEEIYSMNLMPIFIKFLSTTQCEQNLTNCLKSKTYTVRDISCDGLNIVVENKVIILPCRTEDDRQILTWFVFEDVTSKPNIKIYVQKSSICADPLGDQTIAAFQHGSYVYITTSAYFYPEYLCVDIYDLADLSSGKINYIDSVYYTYTDFTKNNSEVTAPNSFNFRDFVFFNIASISEQTQKLDNIQHFLVATCYNNGLMFFKAVNLHQSIGVSTRNQICFENESEDSFEFSTELNLGLESTQVLGKPQDLNRDKNRDDEQSPFVMYFRLNFIYKVKNLGRIFIESEYSNEYSKMTFFSSTSSPPVVYEFAIDEYLNVNTKKIYEIKNEDSERYTGNDMISVTQKFIAFLIFDNKMLRQSIRILYRDETNFAIGHTHILLNNYRAKISTIKFLSFKNSNVLYIRNTEQWNMYEIKDIELIIDAYSNSSTINNYLFKTFKFIISSFDENDMFEKELELYQKFNITFTDPTDLNIYFIKQSESQHLQYSYGNMEFKFNISDYYMGPNMKFSYKLNSSDPYGPDIDLPKVINSIIEKPKYFNFEIANDCNFMHISTEINYVQFKSTISLYCMQSHFIDQIVFRELNKEIISAERIEYPYSNFIDMFVTEDSSKYLKYEDILILLSREKDSAHMNYKIHIFDIEEDKIFWVDKFSINTTNKTLRKYRPMISLDSTNVIMLVEESETICFVVSADLKFKDYILSTSKRIRYAYPVFGSQLYISHYNDSLVSIYKFYKYQEESKRKTISIELIRIHNFTQVYCEFNVDLSGIALVFTQPNNIFVYQIKSVYIIDYLCRLNFFKYKKEFTYITDENNNIVYDRYESFLYIIMENMTDPTDRVLFIFDYTTNSHNSLKTVLKLEKKYYRDLISIYTEVFDFQSIKFIYILYGNKTLQLIQFEPENSLVPEFKFSNPFMPNKFSKMLTYSPSNVTLEIFPLLVDRETSDTNTSLNLVVHSENYGQIMELRSKEKDIFYLNIDQQLNISLLDYFDGSNQNYITLCEGNMCEFEYDKIVSITSNHTNEAYIIDAVTNTNYVTKAILFRSDFLFLFYSQNHLMQVYEVTDEVRKVGNDHNYFDLLQDCDTSYINFVKLPRDYSFLIVQCVEFTEYIDASYVLKFFTIDITNEYEVKVKNITSISMNRKAKDVKVVNSPLAKDDLYVIILANDGIDNDSIIYLSDMKCIEYDENQSKFQNSSQFDSKYDWHQDDNSELNCTLSNFDIYTGIKLELDQFIVNSFMFINNEPLFVVSVDNFGLLVIDIVSKSIVDKLCFTTMIENFPNTFIIENIFPIDKNGMRVLIEGKGGFSLYWDKIAKIGDFEHVFVGLNVLEYYLSLYEGTVEDLLDFSKNGYLRVLYK